MNFTVLLIELTELIKLDCSKGWTVLLDLSNRRDFSDEHDCNRNSNNAPIRTVLTILTLFYFIKKRGI